VVQRVNLTDASALIAKSAARLELAPDASHRRVSFHGHAEDNRRWEGLPGVWACNRTAKPRATVWMAACCRSTRRTNGEALIASALQIQAEVVDQVQFRRRRHPVGDNIVIVWVAVRWAAAKIAAGNEFNPLGAGRRSRCGRCAVAL
jgi:hypothetical protein